MDKTTAETAPYKAPGSNTSIGHASITYPGQPSVTIDPFAYGKSTGKANAASGNVPSVVVGGSSEVGSLPELPGNFSVGDNKNVSTPVTG